MTKFSDFIEKPTDADERIDAVLAEVFRKNGNGLGIVARAATVEEFRAEEDALDSVEMHTQIEAIGRMLDFFFERGPDPRTVMQRVYVFANAYRPQHLLGMSQEQLARLFGETKAAQSWRALQLITSRLHAAGAAGTRTRGQKSATACATFSNRQKGKKNRSARAARPEAKEPAAA